MEILEGLFLALGVNSLKELGESAKTSKTLTVMIIVGTLLIGGFFLFLYLMAKAQ
ncbi:hypothetical protein [Shewanella donghaensis]|uniref:hypothetical protein n=1 Tax=Shewanella donghaensis TaxID=238836 RepID=UPI0013151E38|nr:hypothetical protein [Shewanella donghaensis]